jgi:hypothetical protein
MAFYQLQLEVAEFLGNGQSATVPSTVLRSGFVWQIVEINLTVIDTF